MDRETAGPRSRARFMWPDGALLRLAALAFFGLMAEGAIGDWASVYLHSNVGVTPSMAAAGYAAYAIAMAAGRFSGDWLAQRVSGKSILYVSGLLVAAGMGCALLLPAWWPACREHQYRQTCFSSLGIVGISETQPPADPIPE